MINDIEHFNVIFSPYYSVLEMFTLIVSLFCLYQLVRFIIFVKIDINDN